ncbi:MAG: SAF domain-containing protein [Rhodoluna sp.]
MSMMLRRRTRKVSLAGRLGSRRSRLLISFSLVLVALASFFFSSEGNSNSKEYFVAVTDLAQESELTEDNVALVRLELGEQQDSYLQPSAKKTTWLLRTPVRAGELVPLSALEDLNQADCVAMKMHLGIELSEVIRLGNLLDIWAGQQNSSVDSAPVQIVTRGELRKIFRQTDALSRSAESIEICVSVAEIRSVVHSIAKQDVLVGVLSE